MTKSRLDEAKERFMQLVEYTTLGSDVSEVENDPNAMGGDPNIGAGPGMDGGQMGGDPSMGGDPMGGDQSMGGGPMGGDPMGGDQSMGGDPMGGDQSMGGGPIGGDTNMGGDTEMGAGQEPQGFQPQGVEQNAGMDGMGSDDGNDTNDNQPGPDDDVVEVDDLTDSQKETEKKVDSLSHKFEKLMSSLDGIEKRISDIDSHTNQYIGVLKGEMDKRNPTPLQRLSMRSTKSSPYSMTPNEYVNNYMPDNYSDADDNNGADDPQYKITKGDVDDFIDYNSIAKEIAQNNLGLKEILGY